jgi:hypothetical protein
MKRTTCYAVLFLACWASSVFAGSIEGVTKQLDGKIVSNVQIQIVDLDNGEIKSAARSNGSGNFRVPLPAGSHVSVEFSERNHSPAALVGISGDVVLRDFDVFLPAVYKKEIRQPSACCGCGCHGLVYRRH